MLTKLALYMMVASLLFAKVAKSHACRAKVLSADEEISYHLGP